MSCAWCASRRGDGRRWRPWRPGPSPTPGDPDTTRQVLESPHCQTLGAENPKGALVGHVLFAVRGELCHLLDLAVLPEFRRRGVGRRLIAAACDAARRGGAAHVFLEVRSRSAAALRFYESLGFWEMGVKPEYYPDTGEDARVLTRSAAAPADQDGGPKE